MSAWMGTCSICDNVAPVNLVLNGDLICVECGGGMFQMLASDYAAARASAIATIAASGGGVQS